MRVALATSLLVGLTFIGAAHAEERLGASYFSSNIAGNSTVTIFPASSNVSGASVRTVSMATLGSDEYLQADYPDGTHHIIYTVQSVSQVQSAMLSYPILLPPGVGLSISNVGSAAGQAFATYDLH